MKLLKPRFNDVFFRINLPRIKDGAYVKDLDEKQSKETDWVLLFIDRSTFVYFDSCRIEYISQIVKQNQRQIQHKQYI